ncbi:hypothetical protein CS542_01420 [Pedobacter sp. IW39]|nr:hypothetical protein CS542_01420 [Pedobacter sp. IW39]
MKSEIVYLPAVRVYPWATIEEFTKDFLAMKVADDDKLRGKICLHALLMENSISPRDAGDIFN